MPIRDLELALIEAFEVQGISLKQRVKEMFVTKLQRISQDRDSLFYENDPYQAANFRSAPAGHPALPYY